MRKVLRATKNNKQLHTSIRAAVREDLDYEKPGKPEIDWEDPEARKALLTQLVQDAQAVQQILEAVQDELNNSQKAARDVLAAVTLQDVEQQEDGSFAIKNGVAKDRVITTMKPENAA